MKATRLPFALIGVLLVAVTEPARAESPIDHRRLAVSLVDAVVIPAYERHAAGTTALEGVVEALCAAPDETRLIAARQAFHEAMDAWQAAAVFDFGPVSSGAGRARVQFWPDRRGTASRQLRRVLGAEDPSLLEPGALAGKSVALGDLQLLERLLFDERARLLEPAHYRCALAHAVAAHQSVIAAQLVARWTAADGHRTTVATAADGNEAYRDAREAALDLYRGMVAALEAIVTQKLDRPLGDDVTKARPKRAESWRSGRSGRNVARNLDTLIALFETPGGFSDQMRAGDAGALAESMEDGFRAARDRLDGLPGPLSEAVGQPGLRGSVVAVRNQLDGLLLLLREGVSLEVELEEGFNALDGDG